MRPSRFDEASTQEIIDALEASIGPEKQALLRKIDYRTFLSSAYWEAIRVLVFRRSPKCACGERATVVHHLTYEHRGQEWRHLDDLEAVCRPCHEVESIQAIADRGGDGITTMRQAVIKYGRENF